MLNIKTATGTVYRSDLLELVEEAAGPKATHSEVCDQLIELINRLIRPAPGHKAENALDQVAKAVCTALTMQAPEVQTYVLLPVLDITHQVLELA